MHETMTQRTFNTRLQPHDSGMTKFIEDQNIMDHDAFCFLNTLCLVIHAASGVVVVRHVDGIGVGHRTQVVHLVLLVIVGVWLCFG